MDLSQFLDVTCDEGESPLFDSFTEEDIVLLDEEPLTAAAPSPKNGKRAHPNYQGVGQRGPPVKKVRRAVNAAPGAGAGAQKRRQVAGGGKQDLARTLGLQALSAQAVGILQSQNITVKKIQPAAGAPRTQPAPPVRPAGSITWKYKQLMENQYTADIRDETIAYSDFITYSTEDPWLMCQTSFFENTYCFVILVLRIHMFLGLPDGSVTICQRSGSGSFYQAKLVRKTLIPTVL
jgi:hypothetical protein